MSPSPPWATDDEPAPRSTIPDNVRYHVPPKYTVFGREIPNRTKERIEVQLDPTIVNKAWEKVPDHPTRSSLQVDRKRSLLPEDKRRQLVPESLADCHPTKGSSYKVVNFDDLIVLPESEAQVTKNLEGKSRQKMLRDRVLVERAIEQEHYNKYEDGHPLFVDQQPAIVEGYVEKPQYNTNTEMQAQKRRNDRVNANLTVEPYDPNPARVNTKNSFLTTDYVEKPGVPSRVKLFETRRVEFIEQNKMAARNAHEQKDERVKKMDDESILRGLLAERGKSRKELLESRRVENIAANAAVALANEKEPPKFSDPNDNPSKEMWWKMKADYEMDPNSTSSLRFRDTRNWWKRPHQYNHYEDPTLDTFKGTYVRDKPWVVPLAEKITVAKATTVTRYEEHLQELADKGIDPATIEKKPKQKRFTDLIIAFRTANEDKERPPSSNMFEEKPMYSSFSSNNIFNPAKSSRGSSRGQSSRGLTAGQGLDGTHQSTLRDGGGSPGKASPRGHAFEVKKPDPRTVRAASGVPTTMEDSLRTSTQAIPLSRKVADGNQGIRSSGFQRFDGGL